MLSKHKEEDCVSSDLQPYTKDKRFMYSDLYSVWKITAIILFMEKRMRCIIKNYIETLIPQMKTLEIILPDTILGKLCNP